MFVQSCLFNRYFIFAQKMVCYCTFLLLLFLTHVPKINSITTADFFPYGAGAFDAELQQQCTSVSTTFGLFLNTNTPPQGYKQAHICKNGLITFVSEITGGTPVPCFIPGSGTTPFIATFWADSTTACGHVWFRRTHDPALLPSLSAKVNTNFGANGFTFTAKEAIVATWEDVTPNGSPFCDPTTPKNSFQTVVVTDGSHTFVIILFAKIEWTTTYSMLSKDALVGFDAGDQKTLTYFTESCTSTVNDVTTKKNVAGWTAGELLFLINDITGYKGMEQPKTIQLKELRFKHLASLPTATCVLEGDVHAYPFDGGHYDPQSFPENWALAVAPCGLISQTDIATYKQFAIYYKTTVWPGYHRQPCRCCYAQAAYGAAETSYPPTGIMQFRLDIYEGGSWVSFWYNKDGDYKMTACVATGCFDPNFKPAPSKYTVPVLSGIPIHDVTVAYKGPQSVTVTFNNNWRIDYYDGGSRHMAITIQKDDSSDLNTIERMFGICGTLGGPVIETCVDNIDFEANNGQVYKGTPKHSCSCWSQCWQYEYFDLKWVWSLNQVLKNKYCPVPKPSCLERDRILRKLAGTPDPTSYCNSTNKQYLFQQCSMMKNLPVFNDCQDIVASSFTDCIMDLCGFQNSDIDESMCLVLNTFATKCSMHLNGKVISWRTGSLCPPSCPLNMHYKNQVLPCLPTCANPLAMRTCTEFPQGGCTCDEGMLFNGTNCISPSQCGCVSPDGTFYSINATMVRYDCSQQCTCKVVNDQLVNDCVPLPHCVSNAVCTILNNGLRGCKCNGNFIGNGYTGCYENMCYNNPCKNGADCTPQKSSFTCTCVGPFTGHLCETSMTCQNNPCQNSGTCKPSGNSYQCTCPEDYMGHNCEYYTNSCSSSPCQHGGTCTNGLNSYTCSCPEAWEGSSCQKPVNFCLSNPCKNGATCNFFPGGYNCTCPPGFGGQNCQTNLCSPNPCRNGGQCLPAQGGYTCQCLAHFTGKNCEHLITTTTTSTTTTTTTTTTPKPTTTTTTTTTPKPTTTTTTTLRPTTTTSTTTHRPTSTTTTPRPTTTSTSTSTTTTTTKHGTTTPNNVVGFSCTGRPNGSYGDPDHPCSPHYFYCYLQQKHSMCCFTGSMFYKGGCLPPPQPGCKEIQPDPADC